MLRRDKNRVLYPWTDCASSKCSAELMRTIRRVWEAGQAITIMSPEPT